MNSNFFTEMQVRDCECDRQGIVNNALYQNYLQHARHEFLLGKGLGFAELTAFGVIIAVIRASILDFIGQDLRVFDKTSATMRRSDYNSAKRIKIAGKETL